MKLRLLLVPVLAGLLAVSGLPDARAQNEKDKDAKKDDKPKDKEKDKDAKKDDAKKDEKPKDKDVKKDDKPKEDPNKKDQAALEGTWKVEKAQEGGEDAKDLIGAKFSFKGDKVTVTIDKDTLEFPYTLDADKKPKQINFLEMGPGAATGEPAQGIYELNGDTLKLCVADADLKKRPTEFKSTKDDKKITYIELKREKK